MEYTLVNLEPKQAITIRDHCTAPELGKKFTEIYGELSKIIEKHSLKFVEHPFGIYHKYSPEDVDLEAGMFVEGNPKPEGRMNLIETYKGRAIRADFYGPYEKLHEGWNDAMAYAKENNFELFAPCFEIYITDPRSEQDSSKWHTELYLPVK